MGNIVNEVRFNTIKMPQVVPTIDELLLINAIETGDTVLGLPEGRDNRIWVVTDTNESINLTLVPDNHGFYLEDFNGSKWRPADFYEMNCLISEMAFQIKDMANSSNHVYTEEEVKEIAAKAHWHGWVCRERLYGPDSYPVPIAFPVGLDYEGQEEYSFEYFWNQLIKT